MKLLRKFADALALNPSLKITPALRSYGVDLEADLARLRKRWANEKVDLLDAAKAELHIWQNGDLVTQITMVFALYEEKAAEMLETLPLTNVISAVESHITSRQYLKRKSADSYVPFGTTDVEAIVTAITRLETRDPSMGQTLVEREESGGSLNLWEQQYVMAVILHELALEGRQEENCDEVDAANN